MGTLRKSVHMALSKNDLDNLDAAIATAELTVEVQGRRVTYRSMDDLLKARAHVASTLLAQSNNAGQATRRGTLHVQFSTRRGF